MPIRWRCTCRRVKVAYVPPGTTPKCKKDEYFFSQVHGEDYMVGPASIRLASLWHTGAVLRTCLSEC